MPETLWAYKKYNKVTSDIYFILRFADRASQHIYLSN